MFGWLKKKKDAKPVKEVEEDTIDDSQLEKEGIDPVDQLPDEPAKEEALTDFSQDYPGYLVLEKGEILALASNFKCFPDKDDTRHEFGHKKGGRICEDEQIQKKLRSISKEIIKQIGRKILSGSLNLTKISFPIKAMIPKTALETAVHATCLFPFYLNLASMETNPLERFKIVITTTISSFYFTNTFLKPLNPILGETLQAEFKDGTQVYCYFLVVGPSKSYKYYGRYDYDAKAGLNSLTILNKGKRSISFPDGQKINFDFPNELYSGTLMGTLKQESIGKMVFADEKYGFSCQIKFGDVKKKPTDYFQGDIIHNGKVISKCYGTYLGYIEFDGNRYFDHRYVTPHMIFFKSGNDSLQSDHRKRTDLITLKNGDVKNAQVEKEIGEEIQRKDAKLRKEWEKAQEKALSKK